LMTTSALTGIFLSAATLSASATLDSSNDQLFSSSR
jgi:hypothetical protein